jgi:hypothetical protein
MLSKIIVACSIFKKEIEYLKTIGKVNIPVLYLNSMLHMNPKLLNKILDEKLESNSKKEIILIFGDCHSRMIDYEQNKNIVRTQGINCCEILIGTTEYKKIRKDGAFILLPEWASRWKEVFNDYLGFKTSDQLKPFMNDMHKKLVYIDTGLVQPDYVMLNQISEYVGLSYEIYNCDLSIFQETLTGLINL